jgi:hypothetical protein
VSSYLNFPNSAANAENTFSQSTFDRLTSHLLSWRQSPGAFGSVHLHPCWGTISSLERRYHGQTCWTIPALLEVVTRLSDVTGDAFWSALAGDIISNLLFLQADEGGFVHASFEFEPSYDCEQSCPIHQALPLLAFFHYHEWPGAFPHLRAQIRPALDRHAAWMKRYWWKRGNAGEAPLRRPGWCGVTNQDLAQIAALAEYGRLFGDWRGYEEFGRPALDEYLSPRLYLEEFGLFLRGDAHPEPHYVERTFYYGIILKLLRVIGRATGDKRIAPVCDNVTRHLFDAVVKGPDGLDHLGWNIELAGEKKLAVVGCSAQPISLPGYPGLLEPMRDYAEKTGESELLDQVASLESTLAAYVFSDGTLPSSLDRRQPIMQVVPSSLLPEFWSYLARRLGKNLQRPLLALRPSVRRRFENVIWEESSSAWRLTKDHALQFTGIKSNPGAVFIGAEPSANFPTRAFSDEPVWEEVSLSPVPEPSFSM